MSNDKFRLYSIICRIAAHNQNHFSATCLIAVTSSFILNVRNSTISIHLRAKGEIVKGRIRPVGNYLTVPIAYYN